MLKKASVYGFNTYRIHFASYDFSDTSQTQFFIKVDD